MKQHLHKVLILAVAVILGIGMYSGTHRSDPAYAASGGRIYITPSAGSYTVGQEFNATVRVSSPSSINAAFVRMYYNGRGLQVISIQRGADFPNQNTATQHTPGDEGKIYMESTKNSGSKGDFHFATIRFKAKAAGSWGFRPGTESRIINYPSNEVSFTVGRADFSAANPAPVTPTPPTPTSPTPSPPSRPTPTPTPAPGGASEPTNNEPTDSPISESGLQINDLTVSELSYKSALLNWTTTKPSTSKVNFSTDVNDMYNEQLAEEPVTNHSIRIDESKLKAGRHYFFRVTAADENGPVTIDGEFDTTAIPVIIKVVDASDKPVSEATVDAGNDTFTTDENGETSAELPEGTITIFAQKDDLSREISTTINVPTDDIPQRISLNISKTVSTNQIKSLSTAKKKSPLPIILLVLVIIAAVVGFLIWRRKSQHKYVVSDPLEAENYNPEPIPTTPINELPSVPEFKIPPAIVQIDIPDPSFQPLETTQIPHHTTLPELVGRYGAKQAVEMNPPTTQETLPVSPTGLPIPHHTSLKDLVVTAKPDPSFEPNLETPDLPESPVTSEVANSDLPYKNAEHGDGSLTIKH